MKREFEHEKLICSEHKMENNQQINNVILILQSKTFSAQAREKKCVSFEQIMKTSE